MLRLPSLDDRLSCAAALFPACEYGADIGADHGRLSCFLLSSGRCQRMCVSDISEESVQKAKRLLELHTLLDRADICVGDGLLALPQPADSIAILGMGGHTLSKILLSGKEELYSASLVLSAHTHLPFVRSTLQEIHYRIDEEAIVFDHGRYYIVMRAVPGDEELSKKQLLIGPRLIEKQPEKYTEYLKWRIGVASCEKNAEAEVRLEYLKEEYSLVSNRANV